MRVEAAIGIPKFVVAKPCCQGDNGGTAVLAFAVESPQELEGVRSPIISGLVRLHVAEQSENDGIFDDRDVAASVVARARDVDPRLGAVLLRFTNDRKAGGQVGRFAFAYDQLGRKVVHDSLETVEGVPDDVREGGGWWVSQVDGCDVALRLGLVFDGYHIWLKVDVVGDCDVEQGNLMLGPPDLGKHVGEVARHASQPTRP
jgi:hypothetical protein